MCWGLNSHWFPVVGDGHQPNSSAYSLCIYIYIGVSKNRGKTPNHPMFTRVFHEIFNKPSILGFFPYFWFNTHIFLPIIGIPPTIKGGKVSPPSPGVDRRCCASNLSRKPCPILQLGLKERSLVFQIPSGNPIHQE